MQVNFPIRSWRLAALCGLLGFAVQAAAAGTTPSKKPAKSSASGRTSAHSSTYKGKHSRAKTRSSRKRGQKAIESERAQQIQEALIREHYLQGEPSGKWDDATQAALRRFQADQGWQSKTVPDSRALIKLGLGPNHDHLLNPESAMTTAPVAVNSKAKTKPHSVDPPAAPATSTPAEVTPPPQ
jgi:peptidoglycan hydrolase-like protein with peptidoglycan-binding domain